MALNLADREKLRPDIVPRLRHAVTTFLLYTQAGGGNPAPSAERKTWCKDNMGNIAGLAEQLSHWCMSEPDFINNGTSITDAALQARIENVLRTILMPA